MIKKTFSLVQSSSLVLLLLLINSSLGFAQNLEQPLERPITSAPGTMLAYEDTMLRYADSVIMAPMPDERASYCFKLAGNMRRALQQPESYKYPFTRLREKLHIIDAPDGAFRIFNWVVVVSNFQRKYYGVVQVPSGKIYPLYDKSDSLEQANAAYAQTSAKDWYGAEYYNILVNNADGTPVYTLFGYNTNAYYSKRKLIDIMTIDATGPRFGIPIIAMPRGNTGRMILEYKKEAFVNLNYNTEEKKIIFDALISEVGDPAKKYTYVPTGQMDGLVWQGNQWQYVENAMPILRLKDGQAPIDGVIPNR